MGLALGISGFAVADIPRKMPWSYWWFVEPPSGVRRDSAEWEWYCWRTRSLRTGRDPESTPAKPAP